MSVELILAIIGTTTGVLGFVLATISLFRQKRRMKAFLARAHLLPHSHNKYLCCNLVISNISQLPISIRKITLLGKDKTKIECLLDRVLLSTSSLGNEVIDNTYSSTIPLLIEPYGTYRGYFLFPNPSNLTGLRDNINSPAKFWKFNFYTTRGKFTYKVITPTTEEYYTGKIPPAFIA